MTIFIDGDGCPVVDLTIKCAKSHNIPCTILCDYCHVFNKEYAKTITVSKGADAVDFAIVNMLSNGDIVITQDYGLAAMCLAKRAKVLSQNAMEYTNENIDSLLLSRHTTKTIRMGGKSVIRANKLKGNPKRTAQQDIDFFNKLNEILDNL